MSTQGDNLTAIADSIRLMQGGTTNTIQAKKFPSKIRGINRENMPYQSEFTFNDDLLVVTDTFDDAIDSVEISGDGASGTLQILGKNLFATGNASSNGLTATYSDGIFTLSGTATVATAITLYVNRDVFYVPTGVYTLKSTVISGSCSTAEINPFVGTTSGNWLNTPLLPPVATGNTVVVSKENTVGNITLFRFYIYPVDSDTPMVLDDVKLQVQLELGDTATDYVPYAEPVELTVPLLSSGDTLVLDRDSETLAINKADSTIEELTYVELPTYSTGTTIQHIPDDGTENPEITVSLKTVSDYSIPTSGQIIPVDDEETALSMSADDPDNLYAWGYVEESEETT